MPNTSDIAFVEIGGKRIDTWLSYTIASDLLQPADSFSFEIGLPDDPKQRDALRDLLTDGASVRLHVGDNIKGHRRGRFLQLTGILETRTIQNDTGGGTTVTIGGRDLAGHLTDSSVPLDLLKQAGTTFVDVVKAAVEPWGIPVIADSTASRSILTGEQRLTRTERLQIEEARSAGIPPAMYRRQMQREAQEEGKSLSDIAGVTPSERARVAYANSLVQGDIEKLTVRDARPEASETVWDFLDRHAKRLGLLLWFAPNGKLVLGSPRYRQQSKYRFVRRYSNRADDPNNIISGGETRDAQSRYSEVRVLGRGARGGGRREGIQAVEKDESLPFPRPFIVQDRSVRTTEEAERRARRELHQYKANAQVLDYTVPDHGQGKYLYAIDTIAAVDDEPIGVKGRFYITKRTFTKSRSGGTVTELRLVPPGSIVL